MSLSNLTLIGLAALFVYSLYVAVAVGWPQVGPALRRSARALGRRDLRRYSPQNTLFLFGPSEDHAACSLQRRLLKPSLATLISADVSIMEVYGEGPPRRNGAIMRWLDAGMLRHSFEAVEGFRLIYVDAAGRTVFSADGPMLGEDVAARTSAAPADLPRRQPAAKRTHRSAAAGGPAAAAALRRLHSS